MALTRTQNHRYLVVEDDPTFGSIWDFVIHKADPSGAIDWASSCAEATDLIVAARQEEKPYQLVVSDIYLSGEQTGIDLWLRFHDVQGEKFLLVSSLDQLQLLKFFRGLGEPTYIRKPINVSEAIGTIYELLHQRGNSLARMFDGW